MQEITLDLFRVFVTVAHEGSFSAAARALFLSQPAVSQAISQLEHQLGTPLFIRSVRGVTPTPEGAILLEHAQSAIEMLERGRGKLKKLQLLETGALRVGAGDAATRHYLLPRLSRFSERFPGLSLTVQNGTTGELLEYLRSGAIDLALINLPLENDDLVVQLCLPVHDVFVAKPAPGLTDTPLPLSELSHMRLIMLERRSNSRRLVDEALHRLDVNLTPEIELGSHDLLMDFAELGLGVSCVVREFAKESLQDGRLIELQTTPSLPERAIGMAYLKDVPLPAAALRFLDELRA
ncbi:MAG: LysR family transcriptional regulator [Clostridia bacterium]|nr:LysR family transcriptional regulator [Clostridia bacterium]